MGEGFGFAAALESKEFRELLHKVRTRTEAGLSQGGAGPLISREIALIEGELFETEGHGNWPPLSPATVRARARRWGYYRVDPAQGVGAAHPILQWTQRLRDSLTDPRGRGIRDAVIRMNAGQFVQGTKVPYAIHHQRGERKVIDFRPEDEARVVEILRRYVYGERIRP